MDLFWIGIGLGLAAGISPGPLLTLVISTTLERGFRAGTRIAIAPLITDAPIIVVTLLILRQLPSLWLHLIAVLGGCVIIYIGVQTWRSAEVRHREEHSVSGSTDLLRGALVNLLNPHPWLFWATVQGPLLIAGWRRHPAVGIAFVSAFYVAIVGSKIGLAWVVARGRRGLPGPWQHALLIACGVLLIGMGFVLVVQAFRGSFSI